jgi:hypothetical protein
MPEMMEVDAEIVGSLAAANDLRWRQLFEMPVWSELRAVTQGDVDQLIDIAYGLGLVAPFDWQAWYSPDRFPAGHGLAAASVADAVRLITAIVRGDRFSGGVLVEQIGDGSILAAVNRLWDWYRSTMVGDTEYVDHADYSADGVYRWSVERRWAPGASLCWVGLNPGMGDHDHGPRPTLNRVVSWAKREGCSAVVVVNLFSFRSTDPRALRATSIDVVGELTDAAIVAASSDARVTLAAWGADKAVGTRSAAVLKLLRNPVCAGVTKNGEPRHPLYVAQSTPLVPYSVE